jgi:adenylylsulfate kinase
MYSFGRRGRGVMAGAADTHADGFVVWIEGLSGSGKTTLSQETASYLRSAGWRAEILDGDELRRLVFPELGWSRKDRETHARRVSYVARLLARNGVAVLVAMITPYETSRQAARSVEGARFTEIWLKCPLEVCQQRDPKGIYRRTTQGAVAHMTGVDDPFEEPLNPDLTVDTSAESTAASLGRILDHLRAKGFIGLAPLPSR